MIQAGKLTEILKFYQIIETQSESGFKQSEEIFKFKTRAQRTKNKENYLVDADELFHSSELSFRLRLVNEVNENWIVEYDGNRYRITSINKWKFDNEMTIIVSKIND